MAAYSLLVFKVVLMLAVVMTSMYVRSDVALSHLPIFWITANSTPSAVRSEAKPARGVCGVYFISSKPRRFDIFAIMRRICS